MLSETQLESVAGVCNSETQQPRHSSSELDQQVGMRIVVLMSCDLSTSKHLLAFGGVHARCQYFKHLPRTYRENQRISMRNLEVLIEFL